MACPGATGTGFLLTVTEYRLAPLGSITVPVIPPGAWTAIAKPAGLLAHLTVMSPRGAGTWSGQQPGAWKSSCSASPL